MKKRHTVFLVSVLSLISISSIAQSITATDSTLDSAEKQISAKAQQENASYKIIEASNNNRIHITAKLFHNNIK